MRGARRLGSFLVTLHSRILDLTKGLDALIGVPAVRALPHARRALPHDPRDVLFIRLWGLGNLALLAPLFAAASPRRLRLLTLARNTGFVAAQFPGLEVLPLHEPHDPRALAALLGALRRLARDAPDVVIDCEQFLRLPTLLVRRACSAPIVGLDTPGQGRVALLDRAVAHDPLRHAAQTFAALGLAAGLPAADAAWRLSVPPALRERLRLLLPPGDGPLVVLHPGSGDHFPGRRWPASRFAELASALVATRGARLVVTGVHAERGLAAEVARGTGAWNACGRLDTSALLALLAEADLLVSNDTGPVHLADLLDTPTVALYGPNTPWRYGPRRRGSVALFADLPCSPCLDDRNMKRSACRHYACMQALSVADVAQACRAALANPAPMPIAAPQHAAPR